MATRSRLALLDRSDLACLALPRHASFGKPHELASRDANRPSFGEPHCMHLASPHSSVDRAHAHPQLVCRLGWSHKCRSCGRALRLRSRCSYALQVLLQREAGTPCCREIVSFKKSVDGASHATELC